MNPFIINLKSYKDNRGEFYESYKDILLKNYGIDFTIAQENTCISNKNVVRGFHYQEEPYQQAKLLQVLNGKIKDVLVDVRDGNTYGKIWEFNLNSKDKQLLYIPKGFAHGYSVLEDNTIVSYKTDALYNKESETGINPLSKNIDWLVENHIISKKDLNL
jgi:dTDP-4-dehydrorhamnose 3,5-epimerase